MAALDDGGAPFAAFAEFTIESGKTRRAFVVTTGHAVINSANLPNDVLIQGDETGTRGMIVFNPIATHPNSFAGTASSISRGFRDITMLSYWGALVVSNNLTGFAMEFIGDMNDSQAVNTPNFSGLN